jgi:hypothetical protein
MLLLTPDGLHTPAAEVEAEVEGHRRLTDTAHLF